MISDGLKRIILDELELKDIKVSETTRASDIQGWDSLAHVRIIFAVEKAFGVRFSNLEVLRLSTLVELQQLLDSKVRARG